MEYKAIIKSMKEYIMGCPYLDELITTYENDIKSWFLEEGPNHKENISQHYVDGNTERILRFSFSILLSKSQDLKISIEESGFYELFPSWIEDNNNLRIFPILRDGILPLSIELLTTGYFIDLKQVEDIMKYQIQLQFKYEKENEKWIV